MNYELASRLLKEIEETCITELRDELFRSGIRYARIRADWMVGGVEDRKDMDKTRTLAHNTFIDACNILSRNMYLVVDVQDKIHLLDEMLEILRPLHERDLQHARFEKLWS